MMQMINDEIKKSNSDTVTTIWFDSWRYEREEYSLMIPLLRTIILTLHEVINSMTLRPGGKLHIVGIASQVKASLFPLIAAEKSIGGSPIGGPAEILMMLDFCNRMPLNQSLKNFHFHALMRH